eukprot:scaffold10947_cov146-Skeletonema_dohrnii-CCMP3373.AAC.3
MTSFACFTFFFFFTCGAASLRAGTSLLVLVADCVDFAVLFAFDSIAALVLHIRLLLHQVLPSLVGVLLQRLGQNLRPPRVLAAGRHRIHLELRRESNAPLMLEEKQHVQKIDVPLEKNTFIAMMISPRLRRSKPVSAGPGEPSRLQRYPSNITCPPPPPPPFEGHDLSFRRTLLHGRIKLKIFC